MLQHFCAHTQAKCFKTSSRLQQSPNKQPTTSVTHLSYRNLTPTIPLRDCECVCIAQNWNGNINKCFDDGKGKDAKHKNMWDKQAIEAPFCVLPRIVVKWRMISCGGEGETKCVSDKIRLSQRQQCKPLYVYGIIENQFGNPSIHRWMQ